VKVIFWGTPKYAAESLNSIINAGHEIVAVITQPDRKRGRGKKLTPSPVKELALKNKIPVYTTFSIKKDEITREKILSLSAEIYIVVAFGQILPKEILLKPPYGSWNSHASLLPSWRGAAPIQWSLIKGDDCTGVCIMSMEEGLDTGPVINQEAIKINDEDNLETLTNKLSYVSSKLLVKSIKEIGRTKGSDINQKLTELQAIKQSELGNEVSYARQINKEDYLINWENNSKELYNLVRGLYPNAYTIFQGKRIKIPDIGILITSSLDTNRELTNITRRISHFKEEAGTILDINKEKGIVIRTKNGQVFIKSGQLEGKKLSDAYTLSAQARIKIKDKLGK